MAETIFDMLPFEMFRFRVLIEQHGPIVAATCLETGNVATADDQDTAVDMMSEVLHDEWHFNLEQCKSLGNLLSPAPIYMWAKWQRCASPITTQDGIEWKKLPAPDSQESGGVKEDG